ncbi:MAG: efflux RND transporter periplasmic adaptor subunit [Breznakibacter sp.]
MKYLPILSILAVVALSCNNQQSNYSTEVAVPVSVEEVTLKPIRQVYQTSGVVAAAREITFKTEMAGAYELQTNPRTGNRFRMGDAVRNGETIIHLIDQEYENNANLEGAKLDLDISEMEYQKQKALYEKGGVTLRELVNSEKTLLSARQSHENAKIAIAKMQIKAPFDGVVTALPYFSQGIRVESATQVLDLMDYNQMVLDLSFSENLLPTVKVSQNVSITNYTAGTDTLKGHIAELSPAIDKTTRTFAGRVTIGNDRGKLRPGMFVRCEIELQKKDSALVVLKDVVLTDGNSQVVFVAEREAAQRRVVRTGLENNGYIEIVDGLKPGERLIVKGYETLKNRSKIKIVK